MPDYFGDPYQSCRPECVRNSDCPSNKACQQQKCRDPCPGTCGTNADCRVTTHIPTCTCRSGYTGDPYRYCHVEPAQRKTQPSQQQPTTTTKYHLQLYGKPNPLSPVSPRLVAPIPNAASLMAKRCAPVLNSTSVCHPTVDPSAY